MKKEAYELFKKLRKGPPSSQESIMFLVDYIIDRVAQKVYKKNKVMLSHRALSKELGVSAYVAEETYRLLKLKGVLISDNRSQTRISSSLPQFEVARVEPFKERLECMSLTKSCECQVGSLNIIAIGDKALSPVMIMGNGSSRVLNAILSNFSTSVEDWKRCRTIDDRFLSVAQWSRARTRNLKVEKGQMAIGYQRRSVLTDLLDILLRKNGGVILSAHADALVKRYIKKRTKNVFFVKCTKEGMPLDEVERIIIQQRNTDSPITMVFSNPISDSFHCNSNLHERRSDLVKKTAELGVLLLEEYGHDEWVENAEKPLVERVNGPMGNLVTFGPLSTFTAEVRSVFVVMAPNDVIERFREEQQDVGYEEGLYLKVLEKMLANGDYEELTTDSMRTIDAWRMNLINYAKLYLKPWFEVIPADCGTSFWLMVRDGKSVVLPISKSRTSEIPGFCTCNDDLPTKGVAIHGIRVCFGNGKLEELKEGFGCIKERLEKLPNGGFGVLG